MLDLAYLQKLEEYMRSGQMEEDFLWSAEGRRHEMLEFLEKLMDIADMADETATKMIFRGSQLGTLAGIPPKDGPTGTA